MSETSEPKPIEPPASPGVSPAHDGLLRGARWCPSPNFGPRPEGADISLLLIHCISLPPGEFSGDSIEQFFQNRLDHSRHPYFREIEGMKVSAHALIRRNGELVQFVNLHHRAWHAGRSSFQGMEECNDYSVGIELEGTDDVPYTDAQYRRLADVCRQVMTACPAITSGRIAGHCHVAPGRKTDPGPAFDWKRLFASLPDQNTAGGGTG